MKLMLLFCAASTMALHAQATVETGLGAAHAATTTAPAAGLGKSLSGIVGGLDKALKPAQAEIVPVAGKEATPASQAPRAVPAKTYEDLKKAEVGLEYEVLIERFGPPSLETAGEDGRKVLSYSGKEGSTRIEIKDGKVSSITAVRPQSSVFVLPK